MYIKISFLPIPTSYYTMNITILGYITSNMYKNLVFTYTQMILHDEHKSFRVY